MFVWHNLFFLSVGWVNIAEKNLQNFPIQFSVSFVCVRSLARTLAFNNTASFNAFWYFDKNFPLFFILLNQIGQTS